MAEPERLKSNDELCSIEWFVLTEGKLSIGASVFMTWIKTVPVDSDERLRHAIEAQRELYPIEYAEPIHPTPDGQTSGIVASHSLIPDALYHAFSTFGVLMSPELPLTRRQHEMITTVVSVANRCHY